MLVRLCVAALIAAVLGVASQAPGSAETKSRPFKREDYVAYFAVGHFATWSPYYESHGELEVRGSRTSNLGGLHALQQSWRALDVSPNYDKQSQYPYYKILSEAEDPMVWNVPRNAYVFEYTNEDFEGSRSKVWESKNAEIMISPDDVPRGLLSGFYWESDKTAGEDPKELSDNHRSDTIGLWSMACSWLQGETYEVACAFTHEPKQRVEMYYYRRLDLMS